MGNRPKEQIAREIFKVLEKSNHSVHDIAVRTGYCYQTVQKWLPFIMQIQGERRLRGERSTGGDTLYYLE